MAIIYCYDAATGAADGSSWTDAYTTLYAAMNAWTSSDVVYVAQDHNETIATNWTPPTKGSATAPVHVYSVDRTTGEYSKATSVQMDAGAVTADINLTTAHAAYYGLWFKAGDDLNVCGVTTYSDTLFILLEDCTLEVDGSNDLIVIWGTRLYNCDIKLGSSGGFVDFKGSSMIGGSISGASSTSNLNRIEFEEAGQCQLIGVDMSSWNSPSGYINFSALTAGPTYWHGCKLAASMPVVWTTPDSPHAGIEVYNCDEDGATKGRVYRSEGHWYTGSVTQDETIYRSGGWVDSIGSVALSHKMEPSVRCSASGTLRSLPMTAFVGTTGSKTFTVHGVEDYTTALTDQDLYMEILYLGTSDSTLLSRSVTRPTNLLASGTTLTTSSETWTGASGKTKFQLSDTLTVNEAGTYMVRLYLGNYESGKAVWYCPKVEVT